MASQLLGIKTRFTNDLGSPLVGGQVYTYFAGTSTNQDSYSDAALTVPNTNPVILDDTGSADIFLKGSYRIRVFDKSGRFIEEQDNVTQASSQGDATELASKVTTIEGDIVELNKVKLDTGITATGKLGGVARTQAAKNSDTVSIKDFGAVGDGVTDDSEALSLAINYSNSTAEGIALSIPMGVYVIRSVLPTITKAMSLIGLGSRRNTLLMFKGCNGLKYDLTNYAVGLKASVISDIQLTTDSASVYTGIDYLGSSGGELKDAVLTLHNVSVTPEQNIGITSTNSSIQEWAIAVRLELAYQAVLQNCYLRGANIYISDTRDTDYANRIKSQCLYITRSNGVRVINTPIYYGYTGIYVTGQVEGTHIDKSLVVSCDRGIIFENLVKPCNNNIISDTHVSAYNNGMSFSKTSDNLYSVANYISNCFIIERNRNAAKTHFTALKFEVEESFINGLSILGYTAVDSSNYKQAGVQVYNKSNVIDKLVLNGLAIGVEMFLASGSTASNILNNIIFTGVTTPYLDSGGRGYNQRTMLAGSTDRERKTYASEYGFYGTDELRYSSVSKGSAILGANYADTHALIFRCNTAAGSTVSTARIVATAGAETTGETGTLSLKAQTIEVAGRLSPDTDAARSCGAPDKRWKTLYAETGTIATSDERLKTEFVDVSDAEKKAALRIKASIGKYKFLKSIDEKGDDARYHFGVGAQTVGDIMRDEGLDPEQYAFYCYDEWDDSDEIDSGNRYGIRYDELAMFMMSAI